MSVDEPPGIVVNMGTASEILLLAGVLNLLVGALTGIPMGVLRMNGADTAPRYLTMAHMAGLMHGPILIGCAVATNESGLTPSLDTAAAIALAAASALLLSKELLNWRQGVQDEFHQRSLGLRLGTIFGPLELIGLLIITAGVASGL